MVSLMSRGGHGKQMFEAWAHLLQSVQPDRMVVDERGGEDQTERDEIKKSQGDNSREGN